MATLYENLSDNSSLTVHRRAILKLVKSISNGIKKIKWMRKCQPTPPTHCHVNFRTQLPYLSAHEYNHDYYYY
jgi:intein-encoded DNA endonuclease-like protein